MIAITLSVLLAALSPSGAEVVHFSGAELARLAQTTPASDHFILGPNQHASFTLTSAAPFDVAGLWWLGEFASGSVSIVDATGSEAPPLPLLEDLDLAPKLVGTDRPAGARSVSGRFHYSGMVGTSLRVEFVGPVDLEELSLVAIDLDGDFSGTDRPSPQLLGANYPKPSVYSRAAWGANAPACSSSYCNTTHVAIHHSASVADFNSTTLSQCLANVKSIQVYHMVTNGWCDIGYNYLVCKHGDLFEGRAGGDNVKGAHDGYNCGSMGVCLLGYFHPPYNQVPTTAMRTSAEKLAAWKCDQQGINPLTSSFYAGYGAVMNNIYGHRNVSATACPGDLAYALLATIRTNVKNLIDGSGPPPTSGTLKGVLYNANIGTTARIAGGTVSLANGTFRVTGSDGYYEFPLAAGTYAFAATAKGYNAKSASETVGGGDVWESLGLTPNSKPTLTVNPLGNGLFATTFQSDPGKPVFLVYNTSPEIPLTAVGSYGILWPKLNSVATLFLGNGAGNGLLSVTLQTPNVPGLKLHTQGFVVKGGISQLTNGAGLQVQ